jgi:hypothetical protein
MALLDQLQQERAEQLEERLNVQAEQLQAEQAANASYALVNEIHGVELELERLARFEAEAATLCARLDELKARQTELGG